MDNFCKICDKFIKPRRQFKHFDSNIHKEFDKCKHIKLTIENPDINNVVRAFWEYNMHHNKKYDFCLVKCQYKLVINDNQNCPSVMSILFDNRTMISWHNFLEGVIDDFKNQEDNFNHKAEMNIITVAIKTDMSYDVYVKHNMCALEWKLNAMINENKNLIIKLNRNWRYPLNRKFESHRVWLL